MFQVHLVDVDSKELVSAWRGDLSTRVPTDISKTFDIRLGLNKISHKKIIFTNPWPDQGPKRYRVRSSDPSLMEARDQEVDVITETHLRLSFASQSRPLDAQVYVFIHESDTDQQEECLLVRIKWTL